MGKKWVQKSSLNSSHIITKKISVLNSSLNKPFDHFAASKEESLENLVLIISELVGK